MALTHLPPDHTAVRTTTMSTTRPSNPLVECRADPWVIAHEGMWYFTGSYPDFDRIVLRGASNIASLTTAPETVIWTRPEHGDMGGNIWAPELHRINNRWYFYFTAGHADKPFRIRMYVMEGIGDDPLTAVWGEPQRISSTWDEFALDATTFTHNGTLYYVWAQRPIQPKDTPESEIINSDLYIAAMSDPFTLATDPVLLTRPELDWETIGYKVNEGAAVLVRNGRVFITYSASATDHNYAMGLLWAEDSANLLDAASWHKSETPVFTTCEATSSYGPGHNSFTVDEAGRDVLVYHARSYREIVGNPLFDANRHGRVQYVYWDADGFPQFGVPVGDGVVPVRVVSEAGDVLVYVPRETGDAPLACVDRVPAGVATGNASVISASQFRVAAQSDSDVTLIPLCAPEVALTLGWDEIDSVVGQGASFQP